MDIVVVQIAIAFLPGIIWAGIARKYAGMKDSSQTDFLVKSMAFGLAAYSFVFLLYRVSGFDFSFAISGETGSERVDFLNFYDEILISIPVSIFLAVLWVYASNYKLLSKFLLIIHATKRYGDEDVWSFTFNSSDAFNEYIHLRDLNSDLTIAGWVRAFSDHDGLRELLLRDVTIYHASGAVVSQAPHLYIAREPHHLLIEFPYRPGEK